jgi:hypothetical protein
MLRMVLTLSLMLAGVVSTQAQVSFCNAVKALATGSFEYRLLSVEGFVEGPLNLDEAHRVYEYPAKSVLPGYAECRIEFEMWEGDVPWGYEYICTRDVAIAPKMAEDTVRPCLWSGWVEKRSDNWLEFGDLEFVAPPEPEPSLKREPSASSDPCREHKIVVGGVDGRYIAFADVAMGCIISSMWRGAHRFHYHDRFQDRDRPATATNSWTDSGGK